MNKKFLSILKVLTGIAVAAVLLFVVFRQIDWNDFWAKATEVDYSWVYLSMCLSLIGYVARAYRWNLLLEPLGYNLKTSRTTVALMIGYLANLVLPRLGEITRCGVLNRNDRVAMPQALGSVVAERIVDVLTLGILIVFGLLIEAGRLLEFLESAYKDFQISNWLLVLLVTVGLLAVAGFVYVLKNRRKFTGRFASLIQGFVEGLASLKDIKNVSGFVVSTLIIWTVYYFMSYVIVFSLAETSVLDWKAGIMLLVVGAIAISLPVQSGFGTYHGMVAAMLLLYSIELNTGVFLATLLHTSQIVAVGIFGGVAVVLSALIQRKNRKAAAQTRESDD